MPVNAHPDFAAAERKFYEADNEEEKLLGLEEMIRHVPSHKGAEKLRAQLKTRYKKLKEKLEKTKGKKSGGKQGIRKGELQAVLIGLTNSGKSSILKALTNANPIIASYGFSTKEPLAGSLIYQGCNIQIIDLPPIASENFDKGIANNSDTLILVIEKIDEIKNILESITNKQAKKIIVFNKIDLYEENIKRKIKDSLRSKKYNFVLTSTKTGEGLDELKEKIFVSFPIIRIYTRQPREKEDSFPAILPPESTLEDVAKKVLHGHFKRVKYAKVWGPSAKFLGQKIGLKHIVKDKDIIEFYTE
jgi:uncharacterized protein